jgi:hypothetical protein
MIRRRTMPAVAAGLAAMALLAAGCSSATHDATSANSKVQKDADTKADHDADADEDGDAPALDVPGEDGDEEIAGLTPGTEHGTQNRSFTVTGYHATFNLLALSSTPDHAGEKREAPKPPPPADVNNDQQGPAQTVAPTAKPPKIKVNVAGIHEAEAGGLHPPDTSGAIGPKQYVQTVNEALGIYDKSGNQLNFFSFNTFMSQFHTGTPCDNQNGGDPQVIFDQPSNKWIIADLSYPSGGPYYFCMAVSDGPDLTDTGFTAYPFVASADSLNDYPKIASGPNGLFLTSNMFYHFQSFSGAEVWAFNRASLGTKKLDVQTVRTSNQYGSLLPANSYAKKESKGPDYLVSLEDTSHVGLWKYNVNWKHPKKTTFTQTPTLVQVDPYQPAGEIPTKDGNAVDSLSDRPMYQLQLATDGTLWFNHSVTVSGQAGVRWYQLGNIGSTPKVQQQSTFLPKDGLSRWMGSLAVDKDGNMAVGYSTASSTAYPSIKYATRLAGDKKNTLTAEGNIVKGTGSQTVTSRWGDYSQMSLDPTDHCTMWYTTEYYTTTGGDWQTRIASFRFPGCS